jgi:DNA-binding NarL/FixJ family response regulator
MSRSTRALGGPRARLLAVDDHAPFLALLREVVRATMHLELVGEAQSGEGAIPAAQELRPDMILMDIDMPGIGGIKAAEQIQADIPSTLMVLISATHPDDLPPRVHGSCAGGIIWKGMLEPKLLDEVWSRHNPHPRH